MTTVFETTIAGYDITLIQRGEDVFSVIYGKQRENGLSYAEAAKELGQCIMHALACEGKLENESEVAV